MIVNCQHCGSPFKTFPSRVNLPDRGKFCGLDCYWTQKSGKPTKHGGARTVEYHTWIHIKGRCHNPNDSRWKDYGGRGIVVCERWRNSFPSFLEDMGHRPKGTSLDRYPDMNGNYEPSNCRWATPREQQNNARFNRRLTFDGKTMTVAEWTRALGWKDNCIETRIPRGWTVQEALTTPVQIKRRLQCQTN